MPSGCATWTALIQLSAQCLLLISTWIGGGRAMTTIQVEGLRNEAEAMFYHGFDNYMEYAFPEDELRPITCGPLTRDRNNPSHIELNDPLGNYSVTLIDSLSTLAILASSPSELYNHNKAFNHFKAGVEALVEQYGDGSDSDKAIGKRSKGFDLDSKVQVFETVIRGVGGLLSAHLFATGQLPIAGYDPRSLDDTELTPAGEVYSVRWSHSFTYDGQLLRLAHDLGRRLLPAFSTSTGLPYPRVNLRDGIPFYRNSPLNRLSKAGQCQNNQHSSENGELTETCSAGAGSLVLEFTTLSRLTGDFRFEQLAKRAFWSIWERRSAIGLLGSGIDAESGQWMTPYTGIGAGIDSFYEYAAKSSVLLSGSALPEGFALEDIETIPDSPVVPILSAYQQSAEAFLQVWEDSHAAIRMHLYRGDHVAHPHYVQGDLFTGATRAFWIDSLSAFYPGLLSMMGEVDEAIETHLLNTALWTRYSALPERWSSHTGGVEAGLAWWGGRPEFIESTYHLYQATQDPWYLHVGEMVIRDIKRRCWVRCGWTGLQDVRSGDKSDRMESFFLGETAKYLFLLFDLSHPLNKLDIPYVFSTEGHPLIIPRHRSKMIRTSKKGMTNEGQEDLRRNELTCPHLHKTIPFSISITAARHDVFHAAKLAGLHLMPAQSKAGSPLIEWSKDHPSLMLSDLRSPSNYTYYPWTLPLELIPYNGVSSQMNIKNTFDIGFPTIPNTEPGPGYLQRVEDGLLIHSISGVRLGMVQDVPSSSQGKSMGEQFRVHIVNNIILGKSEKIYIAKDTASRIISPLDPNFTRVRDTVMLDLVVDIGPSVEDKTEWKESPDVTIAESNDTSSTTSTATIAADEDTTPREPIHHVFSALVQQVAAIIGAQRNLLASTGPLDYPREYVAAVTPVGPGAAPLPDVEEALGPDVDGAPQGSLLWGSIYITDQNCGGRLPRDVPKEAQVIVMRRGGCSFARKLQNVPTFAPSGTSLQLVVVVSYGDEKSTGMPDTLLMRPLIEVAQTTSSGLPRHNLIPMIMVGGGDETFQLLRRAVRMGIKRRYTVEAQGVPISNLVIL